MTKNLLSILSALLLTFYTVNAADIKLNTPERIARLLEQIPCQIPQNGNFHCRQISDILTLYTESNHGVVCQVGVRIFNNQLLNNVDLPIYQRIERLLLELLLKKDTDSQKALLKEYGIRMVYDGYPLGIGAFRSLNEALELLQSATSVSLDKGDSEIIVLLRDNSDNTLCIYIPADRDLVFPYDKKEAEEVLWTQLTEAENTYRPASTDTDDMQSTGTGLYISGGAHYMIDSLNNDVFYQRCPDGYCAVFNSAHPVESVRNMLMGVLPEQFISGKSVSLHFKAYNRNMPDIEIPLGTLIMFLRNQELLPYSAYYDTNGSLLKCLLVLRHPDYKYVHMILAEVDTSTLFGTGNIGMKADMSMFIPQQNIKTLFNEFNK